MIYLPDDSPLHQSISDIFFSVSFHKISELNTFLDTNEPADVSGADDADTAGVPADGDDTGGTEINGLEMEEAGELEDIVINEVAATQ